VAASFLFIWPREDEPGKADAVVVLAGDNALRVPRALHLVDEGVSDVLVVSDGMRTVPALCREREVICFLPDPYSTTGEAEGVARLARERGWRSVVMVTSRYHVFRSRLLFERCLDQAVRVVGAGQPGSLPIATVLETGKLIWALVVDRRC
jgi:uncharacterized SAM-binding protein YcdF (DUF218 family)